MLTKHPDVHAAASRWSEEQTLHVAAVYSNPFRWRTRRELANDFRRHIHHTSNVDLHFLELAYGDRPFETTGDHPNDLQLRTRHELFHKENLLNLAVARFPVGWRYGAIVDADFHFTRHDWALEAVHQLQHYDWVQLFSSYANATGETVPGDGHRLLGTSDGFAYRFVKSGCALPPGYDGGWSEPSCSGGGPPSGEAAARMPWVGSPGGAWAFRRESWDAVGGLLDKCILGSADWFMAFGLAGEVSSELVEERLGKKFRLYRPEYREYIHAWQARAREALHGNIGYVDQFAVHHWHGPIGQRGYATRDDVLIKNGYSPLHDVHPDWQGVLQLTTRKPRLRDAIRSYFLSRSEDLPHV
jgi:hypothetical protein